jgi:hypothetical protein
LGPSKTLLLDCKVSSIAPEPTPVFYRFIDIGIAMCLPKFGLTGGVAVMVAQTDPEL